MPSWCNEDGEPAGDWQAAITYTDPAEWGSDPYDEYDDYEDDEDEY